MPDIEEALRALADLRAAHVPEYVLPPVPARPGRRRRAAVAVLAATVTAATVVAGLVVGRSDDPTPRVHTPGGASAPTGSPWDGVPRDEWTELPPGMAAGRTFPVAVWSGRELLVWGGETASEQSWTAAGSAYDAVTGRWRAMAPSPLAAQSEHVAVWTGDEMVVCCGRVGYPAEPFGGDARTAAYRPDDDTWRVLADPPFSPRFAVAGWTGDEMFVAGGVHDGGATPNERAAMYDPAADRWREVAPPPAVIERNADLAFTGDAFVIWPREVESPGLVYDVAGDAWSELPPLPPGLRVHGASMVWTGEEVVVWGASATDDTATVGARLTLEDRVWRPIADAPLAPHDWWEGLPGSNAAVWTGREMLVWSVHDGNVADGAATLILAYDPTTDAWRRLPDAPGTSHHPIMLWADDTAVVLGERTLAFRPSALPVEAAPADATSGADALLFAENGNGFGLAVADLVSGHTAVYGPDDHVFGRGAVSGALLTARGELVVWQTGRRTQVFSPEIVDGRPRFDAALTNGGRELGNVLGERQVVATEDGDHVWIRASVADGDDGMHDLEYVDLASGDVQLTTRVANAGLPGGTTLFGAIGDDAVVVDQLQTPDERVARVAPDGNVRTLERPGGGSLVAVGAARTLWAAPDGTVLVADSDGREQGRIEAPGTGRWYSAGRPTIPSNTPGGRAFTSDGSRALLGLSESQDSSRLVLVDVVAMTAAPVDAGDGARVLAAFWSGDDEAVVVVVGETEAQRVVVIDSSIGARRELGPDTIPSGFFVLAAG